MKILNSQFSILNGKEQGSLLVYSALIIFIFSIVMVGMLSYAVMQMRLLRSSSNREAAFHIAEAGANYYQWHLAHDVDDFADGTGNTGCNPCGPYVHNYVDKDTNDKIGEYSLLIYPPPTGSTVVTIESTGYTMDNPAQKRKVTARYGIPSLAKYAFLTNADVWIGSGETVNGELHANGGIRFDGVGNAPITSSRSTYTCQSWSGSPCPASRNGVWGSASASTQAYWRFPVANVDFSTITTDFASLKINAQSGGLYLPPSNAQGYSIVLSSSTPGQAVKIYKVTSLRSHSVGNDVKGDAHNEDLDYNNRTLIMTVPIPGNGIIYSEDRTWVEGSLNGRLTIAAAKLPYNSNNAPSILIPNSILYAQKDGTDSLGLIAQKDILVTYYSPDILEIDAALIAQNGSVQRYNFSGNVKTRLTTYGALSSFGVWTWSWVNGSGSVTSGYQNTVTTYDANLLYGPPPNFPLTTEGYRQISWGSN